MTPLPSGTVTFLLTDVGAAPCSGSAARTYAGAGARLDEIVKPTSAPNGALVKPRGEGDSHFVVFDLPRGTPWWPRATSKITLIREPWPPDTPIRDPHGPPYRRSRPPRRRLLRVSVNRCARLRAVAHGGPDPPLPAPPTRWCAILFPRR